MTFQLDRCAGIAVAAEDRSIDLAPSLPFGGRHVPGPPPLRLIKSEAFDVALEHLHSKPVRVCFDRRYLQPNRTIGQSGESQAGPFPARQVAAVGRYIENALCAPEGG